MYFLEDLDEEEYEIAIKVSKDFYCTTYTQVCICLCCMDTDMPNSIRNKLDSFLCPNERNEQKTPANSSLNIFVCIKGDIKHLCA